jgi:homoserine kinase
LYNTFTYEMIPEGIVIEALGQDAGLLPQGKNNLAAESFYILWDKLGQPATGIKITSETQVPVSRGLGSSSTAVVAGLMAANALAGSPLGQADLVTEATLIEGHPDNVAPAILGGMTINVMEEGKVRSLKLAPAKPLKLVVLVPDMQLSTAKARAAMPKAISVRDSVYSTSRAALLIGALATGRYEFLSTALQDKIHTPYRLPLIPGAQEALKRAQEAGAYQAVISGSGSTLMAYAPVDADLETIGRAMREPFTKRKIDTTVHLLDLDFEGAKIF